MNATFFAHTDLRDKLKREGLDTGLPIQEAATALLERGHKVALYSNKTALCVYARFGGKVTCHKETIFPPRQSVGVNVFLLEPRTVAHEAL